MIRLLCLASLLLPLLWACEPLEEKLTDSADVKLSFSQDTVHFDTVLTSLGSITKRFKVYNSNARAIRISDIRLAGGSASRYAITVNGEESDAFSEVMLLGKDSLQVLVKVTIDPRSQDLPFIVKDSVVFETNGNVQDVKLVAWGQDAHFLRNQTIDCNSVWTGTKPYVVYGTVLVDSLCALVIEKGTKVLMNTDADFFVKGSLLVEGTPEDPVVFSSIRQDSPYDSTPGQWGAIVFLGGSKGNVIEGAHISNAVFGLYTDLPRSPDKTVELTVRQSVIQNMSYAGLWSFSGQVSMENVLINNCLVHTVACIAGGTYRFDHCTFANYSYKFLREEPAAAFTNFAILNNDVVVGSSLKVTLRNSIIWGSLQEEVLYPKQLPAYDSLIVAENCIIRTEKSGIWKGSGNIFNTDPKFKSPRAYLYSLDTLSPAKDKGLVLGISRDVLGKPRDAKPDLGAFERQE